MVVKEEIFCSTMVDGDANKQPMFSFCMDSSIIIKREEFAPNAESTPNAKQAETKCSGKKHSVGQRINNKSNGPAREKNRTRLSRKPLAKFQIFKNGQSNQISVRAFECPIENCGISFANLKSFNRHKNTHKYICTKENCKKSFTNYNNWKFHRNRHDGIKQFVCDDCEKSFFYPDSLKRHRLSHTGKRPYVCLQKNCGKSFTNWNNWKYHQNRHNGIQPYRCVDCDKTFTYPCSLKVHRQSHADVILVSV